MKHFIKKKPRKGIPYCERSSELWYMRPMLRICQDCHFTMKRNGQICPLCRSENVVGVGLTARPPKRGDKKGWQKFWEKFKDGSHPEGCR